MLHRQLPLQHLHRGAKATADLLGRLLPILLDFQVVAFFGMHFVGSLHVMDLFLELIDDLLPGQIHA